MRKVFKNGNSLAVTVPKAYARELSIRDGTKVEWKATAKGLLLRPVKKLKTFKVNEKFARMVDEFIKDHEDVLQALAKR